MKDCPLFHSRFIRVQSFIALTDLIHRYTLVQGSLPDSWLLRRQERQTLQPTRKSLVQNTLDLDILLHDR